MTIKSVVDFASGIIDKIWPDPIEAQAQKVRLFEAEQAGRLKELDMEFQLLRGQQDINKEEAKHANIFVSGWRPFVGWVCGFGFAYHFVLQPFLAFLFAATGKPVDLPVFDMDQLSTLLMGMLGFGGLRTYEKVRKVVK